MKKNKILFIILSIIIVLAIILALFFILNSNKDENTLSSNSSQNSTLSTTQEYNGLNFKLPNDYRFLREDDEDGITYSGQNWVYVTIKASTFNNSSVLEFLKNNDFPENKINKKNINNTTWYETIYKDFGTIFYYYTSEKNGMLYEVKVWADDTTDTSVIEKEANTISKTLSF